MAEIRCKVCGMSNPGNLQICQFCYARLSAATEPTEGEQTSIHPGDKPVRKDTSEFENFKIGGKSSIHPGEKPTRKSTGELEPSLPDWLQDIRGKADQSKPENPPEISPGMSLPEKPKPVFIEKDADSLEWLKTLGNNEKEEEQAVPDWMSGLRDLSTPAIKTPEEPAEQEPSHDQDWLKDSGGEVTPPDAPLLATPGDLTPGWLDQLGKMEEMPSSGGTGDVTPPPGSGETSPESGAVRAEIIPDWLQELKSTAAQEKKASSGEADGLPDWLSNLPAIPMESEAPAPTADEPDWLEALKSKAGRQEVIERPTKPKKEASAPDWFPPQTPASGGNSAFVGQSQTGGDQPGKVPEWLSQLQADVDKASKAEKNGEQFESATTPFASQGAPEQVPDWLEGIDQVSLPSRDSPALVVGEERDASSDEGQAAFSLESPDWLSQLRPERKGSSTTPGSGNKEPAEQTLEAAELPSWVKDMRPVEAIISEAEASISESNDTTEASGPLAGLRGVLPTSLGAGSMRKPPAYADKLQATNNQQRFAAQLERMILDEGRSRELPAARLISHSIWRFLVALVILAAVLFPLVGGGQSTPEMVLFPSEWETTSLMLNELNPDAPILMVFDYDPALSGELEAAAAPVIDHILYQGSRLALVSTNPTGPALAEKFLSATQKYHLDTGLEYTNLGYLAGGPVGIRFFASDPGAATAYDVKGDFAWQSPALEGTSKLSDFSALIILTDNADTGRAWIEQTHKEIGTTPTLMIISAQIEPMIRPYYDSDQVQGLVIGLMGGKSYEQSYATPGLARRYWDSFGSGATVAVIMIAIGGAWGMFALPAGTQADLRRDLTMPIPFSVDLLTGLVSFLLTLMVLSYLIGDNPAFRVAIYLFIGASAGYAAAIAWNQVLKPRLFVPLLQGGWTNVLLLVPFLLGLLMFTKLSNRFSRLGSMSLAVIVGVGAAVMVGGAVLGTLFPQTEAVINTFALPAINEGLPRWLGALGEATLMLLGTVSTLVYFHFSARNTPQGPRRGKVIDLLASVGRVFVAITFGVLFAGAFAAALTALIERMSFLIGFVAQFF